MKPEICVAYLARASNDFSAFQNFIRSYSSYESGVPHQLLVIYKGFGNPQSIRRYEEELKPFRHAQTFISDNGFDITAYMAAARSFEFPFFCFLNSFSRIQDNRWLEKLFRAANEPKIGMVSATGSWESFYSNIANEMRVAPYVPFRRRISRPIRLLWAKWAFDPFPNYHLRSNAFVIRRSLFQKIARKKICTKWQAWRFESGKDSLSKQILTENLDIRVVGKDGKSYTKEQWSISNTFRQQEQQNLLVADNRTDQYINASPEEKRVLSQLAWRNY